jgi:hypothetical protein
MGKSLLTEDKQKNPGEFTWGLPVLKILLVRASMYIIGAYSVSLHTNRRVQYMSSPEFSEHIRKESREATHICMRSQINWSLNNRQITCIHGRYNPLHVLLVFEKEDV